MKKKVKKICGNCKLFDPENNLCAVCVIADPAMAEAMDVEIGARIHIPVDAGDKCFYEERYFDPTTKAMEDFNEIKEVQFWVENQRGDKVGGDGVVKIKYPEGFFGESNYKNVVGPDAIKPKKRKGKKRR